MIFTTDGDPIHGEYPPAQAVPSDICVGLTGAFGEDRRVEFIIPEAERQVGVAHYYIEASCNEMFGQSGMDAPDHDRMYRLNSADLVVPNQEAWRLMWDFNAIHQIYNTLPSDSSLAMRAQWAANQIMNVFQVGDLESVGPARKVAEMILGSDWEEEVGKESVRAEKQKGTLWGVGHWYFNITR